MKVKPKNKYMRKTNFILEFFYIDLTRIKRKSRLLRRLVVTNMKINKINIKDIIK